MKCKCREKKIVIERNTTWKERKSTAQVKKAVKIKVAKNKKKKRIIHSRIFAAMEELRTSMDMKSLASNKVWI